MERFIRTEDGGLNLSLNEDTNTLVMQSGTETESYVIATEDTQELKQSFPGIGAGKLFIKIVRILAKRLQNDAK